ncbi:rhodanese-like domain-containing protein [Ferruginibacter albus]|uniref:rhodanese-like domain-containing protein n=1 Tax=Ferruginibacter albus TaxID=2875540 RepID=UPI001CC48A9F|nr:rhodanese-like domain-containing protein [Ferruginibacter albus]UAY53281.1 rhodanese-like domain-containing protein [Ferruginibacter albus]
MTTITNNEVKERLDKGEQLNLIDVREPFENAEFNIGGKLIPLGNIQSLQIDELEDLKNEEVIFYCRSGKRSATAALILDSMGFTNTKNLIGGMLDWQQKFGG